MIVCVAAVSEESRANEASDGGGVVLESHDFGIYRSEKQSYGEGDDDVCAEFSGSDDREKLHTIRSPGYPVKYPPDVECVRVVRAPTGPYVIELTFKHNFQVSLLLPHYSLSANYANEINTTK